MQRFTDLRVWKLSHSMTLEVYRLTKAFPSEEKYGLVSQLRRAASSVPTNIAEGSKKRGGQDYARFLNVAEGSLAETEYLLMLGRDLGYVGNDRIKDLLNSIAEIARMLHTLRVKVEASA